MNAFIRGGARRSSLRQLAVACIATAFSGFAIAQTPPHPIAYPAKGQSAQQQSSDEGACYGWAKQKTGIDPAQLAAAPPPAQAHGGQRVRGAAAGAATGAVAGAIGGDAGKGAAIGAAAGTVAGGVAHRQQRRQAEAVNAQAETAKENALGTYNQAWVACMRGKGYTVQ